MESHLVSCQRSQKVSLRVSLEFWMPRHANLSNDKSVASLRWQEGDPIQYLVKDPDRTGFYIRISKGGTKTWMYQYRIEGKLERLSLGKYPGTTCSVAFRRYDRARMEVQAGENPAEKKRSQRKLDSEQERTDALTISSLFYEHFLPRYSKPRKRTWHNDDLYFRTRIEPAFGEKSAAGVTPEDVERLVRPIEKDHYTTARLTLAVLRKMYNWAAEYASAVNPGDGPLLDVPNPCRHYRLGTAPPPPMRTLSHEEIRNLWNSLGDSNAERIIKIQLLTGCRVSEAAGMEESELDREAREWIISGDRTKNRRSLVVPVSNRLMEVIRPKQDEGQYVFPASSVLGRTTGTGVLQALKRHCKDLAIQSVGTHTLRKTFITQLARMGVPREIRDRLTNHTDSSVDARHYNAHEYFQEKKNVLHDWEAELMRIVEHDEGRDS